MWNLALPTLRRILRRIMPKRRRRLAPDSDSIIVEFDD